MKPGILIAATMLAATAIPAYAEGDAAVGESEFKRCKACHSITDGDDVFVKGGRTGPNLFGVIGRIAGTEDFKYSDSMVAAGEAGLVWSEDNLPGYLLDPTAFLKEYLDDDGARSKMTLKLKKKGEDIAAYLATFSAE